MRFSTIFFDLDDTLYPPATGLWAEIGSRINQYLEDRLGIPADLVTETREKYFREYGTTLRGLQANHEVDTNDYLEYVHNVPLERYITPAPELQKLLEAIPAQKYIFTNADINHATRVQKVLGLSGVFDGILDVHVISPYCKPMRGAFELALKAVGNPDPRACLLLDDQSRITRAARELGIFTVLVNQSGPSADADATLNRLVDLQALLERYP